MSTTSSTRIPVKPAEFAAYMGTTDDYQMKNTPANYTLWNWTAAESAEWHAFRQQSDSLYAQFSDKKHSNTDIKDQVKALVRLVRKYDNDKATGHKLLDKVASFGSISDCEIFHVKRGTPIAASRSVRRSGPGIQKPVLGVKNISHSQHQLTVTNPDTPRSKSLPEGIKFAKVYRFIGAAAPADIKQYEFIGNAKRGLIISDFSEGEQGKAFYLARYESSSGELGSPSEVVSAVIA
jgi:hypothetical protein